MFRSCDLFDNPIDNIEGMSTVFTSLIICLQYFSLYLSIIHKGTYFYTFISYNTVVEIIKYILRNVDLDRVIKKKGETFVLICVYMCV